MLFKRKKGWEIPESQATPESAFRNRRNMLKAGAAGAVASGTAAYFNSTGPSAEQLAQARIPDPTAGLYPVPRNEKYKLDRDITDEKYSTTYNNFYEYGTSKDVVEPAQRLPL